MGEKCRRMWTLFQAVLICKWPNSLWVLFFFCNLPLPLILFVLNLSTKLEIKHIRLVMVFFGICVVVVFFDKTSPLQSTLAFGNANSSPEQDEDTSHIWISFISVLSSPVHCPLVYSSSSPSLSPTLSLLHFFLLALSVSLFLFLSVIYWQWIRDEGVCRRRYGNIQGNGCIRPDFITSGWEMVGRKVCVCACLCVSKWSDQQGIC